MSIKGIRTDFFSVEQTLFHLILFYKMLFPDTHKTSPGIECHRQAIVHDMVTVNLHTVGYMWFDCCTAATIVNAG